MSDFPIRHKSPYGCKSRDFDIFEELPDGEIIWRVRVRGIENADLKVNEIAGNRKNRFFAIGLRNRPTEDLIEAFMPGGGRNKFVS